MGVIISRHNISTPTHTSDWLKGPYIFTPEKIWWGGECIVTSYFHSQQYLEGWFYRDIIFSPLSVFGQGVIISWHYIFTPGNIWWGGDYIVTLYFHPDSIWWRGDYIVTLYFHCWQYLVRGWLYRDIIFSLLTIFREGVIISLHDILTPDNIWSRGDYIVTLYFRSWLYLVGGDYIVTLYFHSWQYLVRGWLYPDIFSLLTIFSEGVNISWHYIFTPDNIWWGGDYIVTLYFHPWQYLVRGCLYCDIISLLTIFGEGVIISWHIFTPEDIWREGDYIVTLQYHFWRYP